MNLSLELTDPGRTSQTEDPPFSRGGAIRGSFLEGQL